MSNDPKYDLILQMLRACPDLRYAAIAKAMKIDTERVRAVAMHSGIHSERIRQYQWKLDEFQRNYPGESALGKIPVEIGDDGYEPCTEEIFSEASQPQESLVCMGAGD